MLARILLIFEYLLDSHSDCKQLVCPCDLFFLLDSVGRLGSRVQLAYPMRQSHILDIDYIQRRADPSWIGVRPLGPDDTADRSPQWF